MPVWRYKARTTAGEIQRSEIELESRDDVIGYLRTRGLTPLDIEKKPMEIDLNFFGDSVGTHDLVVATRQLATMIDSGLPLVEGLDILQRQADNEKLAETLGSVLYHVESGHTLASALERNDDVFDNLYTSMVSAGEAGGVLDEILDRLATFLEKSEALARKVKGAMIYPAVIGVVAVAAIAALLIFVIPTFQSMFASFDQELPLATQLVVGASNFLRGNFFVIAAATGLAVFGFQRWSQTDSGRETIDRTLLSIPIIGTLIKKTAIARFTRTLGTLLRSGVPILDGLEITANTSDNTVVQEAVMDARSSIAAGEAIANPLESTEVFPPMVTQMIRVGEETGNLDEMLEKIADFYDDEVENAVESLVKAIEPAMMVVLGVIVGGIVIAMYLPIFSLISTVGG